VDIKDVKRGRPALDPALILSELAKTSSKWLDIEVFEQVDSTNDLAIARLSNTPANSVFVITADEQLKGRGRLQREWQSPFGAGIAISIAVPTSLFRCEVSAIPLLAGIAANDCLKNLGADAKLKWPNDLMVELESTELKKIGGILVQRHGDHVVIGIGINVDLTADELPTENATSLSLISIRVSRESLIAQILKHLELATQLTSEEWLPLYTNDCATIGANVTVARKAESMVTGIAVGVRKSGELVIDSNEGLVEITSGDVVQVRASTKQAD
jgi:BirA family biotin operon repressor/biotin-[acetyl-CoA-carboxylase] ligase